MSFVSWLSKISFFQTSNLLHIFCMLISHVADGHNVIDIALVFQTDKEAGVVFFVTLHRYIHLQLFQFVVRRGLGNQFTGFS